MTRSMLVLLLCLALGAHQATSLPTTPQHDTSSLATVMESVKEAMLMAVTSDSQQQADATSNLLPILDLVDGMLDQTKNVSLAEIALQQQVGAADRQAEEQERALLAHLKDSLSTLSLRLEILIREKETAQATLETKQEEVVAWESQLLSFESGCLAPIAPIQKEVQHILRDLGLLDLLHQRLHEIVSNNNNNNNNGQQQQANMQFLLQQVQSLSHKTNLLEQNNNNGDTEQSVNNIERIRALLQKLTEELNGVAVSRQSAIMEIRSNCTNSESDLRNRIDSGKQTVLENTQIVQDRQAELVEVRANLTVTQTNVTSSEHRLQKHLQVVSNRDRITDGLVRHRQAVLMILTQMRQLLRNYITRLDSLQTQDSDTTSQQQGNLALFETQKPAHKLPQQPQNVILMGDNEEDM